MEEAAKNLLPHPQKHRVPMVCPRLAPTIVFLSALGKAL